MLKFYKKLIIKNKYLLDRGDLVQTIIIIAGFAVAAIVAIGVVSSSIMDKGEETAKRISNSSLFSADSNNCNTEEGREKGKWIQEGTVYDGAQKQYFFYLDNITKEEFQNGLITGSVPPDVMEQINTMSAGCADLGGQVGSYDMLADPSDYNNIFGVDAPDEAKKTGSFYCTV